MDNEAKCIEKIKQDSMEEYKKTVADIESEMGTSKKTLITNIVFMLLITLFIVLIAKNISDTNTVLENNKETTGRITVTVDGSEE